MSRRFAVVVVHELLPVQLGKDTGLIPLGLRDRGWEVELHAPAGSGEGWPFPVHVAPLHRIATPAYWAGREVDAGLVYSFFRHAAIMRALRAGGASVVGKGDTDGLLAPRLHPRETLGIALHHVATPAGKALQLGDWLARLGPLHRWRAAEIREAIASADAFVVESDPARRRVVELLERIGAPELSARLRTILNPVAPVFTTGAVPAERERLVVASGRWDDPQKDARALRRALRGFLAANTGWWAFVVGARASSLFAGERVETAEALPREEIAPLLRRARIVASSSRFESFSLAVHEGLASGCSLAGPPLAPFEHAVAQGPYGTVAADLSAALEAEAAAWERGERDPVGIASFWRAELAVEAVAARFEELLA